MFFKKKKEKILGIEFPIFDGKKIQKKRKHSYDYERIDYYYKDNFGNNYEKINNYVMEISSYGFIKANDVRYNKNNSYIIIEEYEIWRFLKPKEKGLHIAFHVKK